MRHILDVTELIIASWLLGGSDNRIPTSHGILDRALETAVKDGAFPPWLREELHFSDSRIGLQCVELPALLDWAQRAQLTSAPNPSYQSTQVQITESAARHILSTLEISVEDAKKWGRQLQRAADTASNSVAQYPQSTIEEY